MLNVKGRNMASSDKASIQPFAFAPAISAGFGLFLVVGSIAVSATSFQAFFSLGGLIIVVGGVVAVAFMSFQTGDVATALHSITTMLRQPGKTHEDLRSDIRCIMEWSRLVNERGTRGLESKIDMNCASDSFINYGLNMVPSDYTPDDVRAMMSTAADASYERDCVPVEVLGAMASHAPAFGMVGTLIGMVTMLGNLSDSTTSIGSTLAVAFLSTLYGVLSARLIYMPAATKLQQDVDSRRFRHQMITEGMVMLAANKSPMYIQDRLNGFLRPDFRDYFDATAKDTEAIGLVRAIGAADAHEMWGRHGAKVRYLKAANA